MKALNLASLSAFAVAAVLTAQPAAAKVSAEEFVKKASVSNQFEIESSKLASQKASDPEVKAFAEQMINDHTKAGEDLKAALSNSKVKASVANEGLDEKHQKILNDLAAASNEDFDKEYLKAQKKAHDEAVSLFRDYSKKGDDEALKTFATNTLPTLEKHQDHVKELK